MGEMQGKAQLPMAEITGSAASADEIPAFEQGLELGRKYAELTVRHVAAWAEEHPGQFVLAGLMAGFVLGKLLFPTRRLEVQAGD